MDIEVAPAKADSLKGNIDWSAYAEGNIETAFAGIGQHLTDEWVLDPKLDGMRARIFFGEDGNVVKSGRVSDVTGEYADLSDNLAHFRDLVIPALAGTAIDGELMPPVNSIETKPGHHTQGPLATVIAMTKGAPAHSAARQAKHGKVVFVAFDITSLQGKEVTSLTYVERRQLLEAVVEHLSDRESAVQITTAMDATAENIEKCFAAGFEGAILKRRDSRYVYGQRMKSWLKIKRMATADFFIIGSKDGKGRNEGKVGSLQLAYCGADGKPVYVADARGFDDATCDMLTDPATGKVKEEYIGKVVEIMGQGRTKNERIRHPHFIRWRPDKVYTDCDRTQLELFTEV
jgi:ATP-dependent DNA ligase